MAWSRKERTGGQKPRMKRMLLARREKRETMEMVTLKDVML